VHNACDLEWQLAYTEVGCEAKVREINNTEFADDDLVGWRGNSAVRLRS
jgi:hypothetical protein